jgi:predicted nucleotidyltransferase
MNFNKQGNLISNHELSFKQFSGAFGYNPIRQKQIENLVTLCKMFKQFGCTEIYVVGSFVTTKVEPGDIDFCVDITYMDEKKLFKTHPEFATKKGLTKVHELLNTHVAFFTSYDMEIVDFFRSDRENNRRGIVHIYLNEL